MIKTILLTGATGFIGGYLLEGLLQKGYKVVVIKRSTSNTWRIKHLLDKIRSYDADKTKIEKIFEENKIDCTIHLATHYKKVHSEDDVDKFIDTIIRFPALILQQMAKRNAGFFINTGTFTEYDVGPEPIGENAKKRAHNLYSAFKIAFSDILQYYSNEFGIKTMDLKLFSPYGPKDNEKLFVYVVKSFVEGKQFETTKGEQKWNWTYVTDIVDAYIKSLEHIEIMKNPYEVFNIGADDVHSIREIISLLERISGKKGLARFTKDYPKNEIFLVNCDNSKAKKHLGWKPKTDLNTGLKEMYEFYSK